MDGGVRTPEGGGCSCIPREAAEPTNPLPIPQLPLLVKSREVESPTPVGTTSSLGKLELPFPGLNRDIPSFNAKSFWGTSSSLRPGLSSGSSSVPTIF